jgi:3-deoxy-D-manno-octulosonic-acid transferase
MDQERFHLLGIDKAKVVVTGNTKFDQAVACPSTGEIDALKSSLPIGSHQKVFIAGSTHPGEEKIILEAFMQMKKDIPDLILIIAPRHPERSQSVYAMFHAREFASLMITKRTTLHADETCDVIVVDTIGLLKKLYGLCSVAFIGGTFSDTGGHNPLEPATFAKPILFGPNMKNFADISNMLIRNNGARYVSDARDLYRETVHLLKDTAQSREMGTNAFQVLDRQTGAVDRTLKIISQHIRHLPKTTAPSYLVPEPLPLIAKE